jgi:GNAT superfamily N-acetyltransferase
LGKLARITLVASRELAPRMRAHLLRREDPLSWSLVPEACDRIRRFCERVGSDAPAEKIVAAYWQNFVHPAPQMIVFVCLDDSGVMAHALLDIEEWAGTRIATVLQYELDRPVPGGEIRRCYAELVRWARSCGATQLQGLAINQRVARVLRQRYGFTEHRILMRRPLAPKILSP